MEEIAPPPNPCSARPPISAGIDGARPPTRSPAEKSPIPEHEGKDRAALVGQESGDDDAHKLGEQERGEGPAVEIDAPQVCGDRRKHGRHGERLEGDKGDGEQETDGEPDSVGAARALVGLRRNFPMPLDRAPGSVQTLPCRARITRRPSVDDTMRESSSVAARSGPAPGAKTSRTSIALPIPNPNQRWLDARS